MGRGCWREKKNSKTGTRTAKGCWLHSYGVRVFVFLLPFYLSGLFWHIWSSFFAKCGYECESVFTFGLALECLMKVRVSVSVRKFDQMMCRLNIRIHEQFSQKYERTGPSRPVWRCDKSYLIMIMLMTLLLMLSLMLMLMLMLFAANYYCTSVSCAAALVAHLCSNLLSFALKRHRLSKCRHKT